MTARFSLVISTCAEEYLIGIADSFFPNPPALRAGRGRPPSHRLVLR